MASVSDKIKSIVGFLTSPFESGKDEDFFDGLNEEFETGYETDRNAALEPAFKQTRPERKVISMPNRGYEGKGYEVVVFEPTISKLNDYRIENNLDKFLSETTFIVANRVDDVIKNSNKPLYTRDVFLRD